MKDKVAQFMRLIILLFAGHLLSAFALADGSGNSPVSDTHESSSVEKLSLLAASGSALAQYELGLLYEYGRGVEQNDATAVFWYEQSAAQSSTNALYRLAIHYDNGWGLPADKKKALQLYQKAAARAHPLAQHDLAIMYLQGSGTSRNLLQAYKWLKIAVSGGNPLMQKHLTMVAQDMSAEEIEMAEGLAEEWIQHPGI